MDRDKILRLAREAGFEQKMRHCDGSVTVLPDALFVRFAALVRAEALEEAAKVCECDAAYWRAKGDGATDGSYDWKADGAKSCAESIRALLTKEPSNG